jgi:cobalt/nickel transport system permease protein
MKTEGVTMHMADALLSPAVGGVMAAASAAALGVSIAKVKRDEFAEKKIPLIGVAGALVFAGQMINFTIPATGSSGHIGGGILLAGLLGGVPAFLSIASVLIIQCLFFADGGVLALGANIFNMGVIPCLLIYPLLFKPLLKKGVNAGRLSLASIVSVTAGLVLGAFAVVLETKASGVTRLPFATFTALMLPIHLAIGVVEGVVTAAILAFVWKTRPEIIDSPLRSERLANGVPLKKVIVTLAALTVAAGGAFSLFASGLPDGLEWSIGNALVPGDAEAGLEEFGEAGTGVSASIQDSTAILPDYAFPNDPDNAAGTTVSGIAGSAVTFALAGAAGLAVSKIKKAKRAETAD